MKDKNEDSLSFSFEEFRESILNDYKLACISRQTSLLLRKEVLSGKAKFAISGDGKELPQIALSKIFKKGDFRSGYYRDQTIMLAIEELEVRNIFAQCYAHSSIEGDPASSGRMMNCHFASRLLDEKGQWKNLMEKKNTSADLSPTAGQMPRLLGLGQASKIYRNLEELSDSHKFFSRGGNEVVFGTIGNASTSEGFFWETINAAATLQIPMIVSIWDDEYGISVPNKYQFAKKNLSELFEGFKRTSSERGLEVFEVKGWDYPSLIKTYEKAEKLARKEHIPVVIHVSELTQPQGHSTSGSHERYKSKERLEWEKKYDCLRQFKKWILGFEIQEGNEIMGLAKKEKLEEIEAFAKNYVKEEQKKAWENFTKPILKLKEEALVLLKNASQAFPSKGIEKEINQLNNNLENSKRKFFSALRNSLQFLYGLNGPEKEAISTWLAKNLEKEGEIYSSHLYSVSDQNVLKIEQILPIYKEDSKEVDGRVILRDNFDKLFAKHSDLMILGEDVGKIGDVNQGLEGLQAKYGETRICDTAIREATIIGQGIGLALRGLRPIVEIQYLDYILYAMSPLSDDLASIHYRTRGGQKVPLIIRTRGHRLEGIWHSGSPMGGLIHLLRGIRILVPRNMTKAAGFYNALLKSDEPALVVECLNGYRIKEKIPENLGEFSTSIGEVEIIRKGSDITLVSYGSTLKIVMQAAESLAKLHIEAEVIDVQSLLPFDLKKEIVKSLTKTSRLAIIDEDVPGGASAYILQKILEEQDAYHFLDSKPITITAKEHRPAYGSDGDYFSKPSIEEIVEKIYLLMHESNPQKYPL